MFNPRQLEAVLDLHEKSFALLKWVRASLQKGTLSFGIVHTATDSAGAAQEWIGRHFGNLPAEVRPGMDQVPAFARLFASFLTTSYALKADAARRVTNCGCWCSWCAYLQAGPNLVPRSPSKKDQATAQELKRIYLIALARERGVPFSEGLLQAPDLARPIALATWGAELVRRSEFVSQGEAVLALWRQFAWENNAPRPRFRVRARDILEAERQILVVLGGGA